MDTLSQHPHIADLLVKQGRMRFRIISNSMSPRLRAGDMVDFEPISWEMLQAGDLLGIQMNGTILCHQLARWFKEDGHQWIVTQTARAQSEDSPTLFSQVIGRVARIRSPRSYHQLAWRLGEVTRSLFRPRPFWRLWIGQRIHQLARAIEFFTLAFLRPDDFIENNRRFYGIPTQVDVYTNKERLKLNPIETYVLDNFVRPKKGGKALVIGCGAGRESYALAERGWYVTGIDQSAFMVHEAEKLFDGSLKADFYCRDISKGIQLETQFDFICLWCNFYGLIPTSKRRIRLLLDCHAHLKPQGVCSLSYSAVPSFSSRRRRAHVWRKGFAWMIGGNTECEIGDVWQQGNLFNHHFSSAEEVIEEARLAGFDLVWSNSDIGQKMLVLERSTKPVPSSHQENQEGVLCPKV